MSISGYHSGSHEANDHVPVDDSSLQQRSLYVDVGVGQLGQTCDPRYFHRCRRRALAKLANHIKILLPLFPFSFQSLNNFTKETYEKLEHSYQSI